MVPRNQTSQHPSQPPPSLKINPQQPTWIEFYGTFNFNVLPLAPIKKVAIIYQRKLICATTFADHGQNGWYNETIYTNTKVTEDFAGKIS